MGFRFAGQFLVTRDWSTSDSLSGIAKHLMQSTSTKLAFPEITRFHRRSLLPPLMLVCVCRGPHCSRTVNPSVHNMLLQLTNLSRFHLST